MSNLSHWSKHVILWSTEKFDLCFLIISSDRSGNWSADLLLALFNHPVTTLFSFDSSVIINHWSIYWLLSINRLSPATLMLALVLALAALPVLTRSRGVPVSPAGCRRRRELRLAAASLRSLCSTYWGALTQVKHTWTRRHFTCCWRTDNCYISWWQHSAAWSRQSRTEGPMAEEASVTCLE